MKYVLTIGPVLRSVLGASILVALMAISSRAGDAVSGAGRAEDIGGRGDRPLLPERPAGCCAQKGSVPFSFPCATSMALQFLGNEPYFPPPESAGGWRTLTGPEDIRRTAGHGSRRSSTRCGNGCWKAITETLQPWSFGTAIWRWRSNGATAQKRTRGAWHRSRRPSVQPCCRSPLNRADWD